MGLFDRFVPSYKIEAEAKPQVISDNYAYYIPTTLAPIDRTTAMACASVAKCRNLIANTIAALPFELYRKSTGERLARPLWMEQPAINQSKGVTIALTVDSLLFYGVAYWQVTEVYADDGRPARFQWIAPTRVSIKTNANSTLVEGYELDGKQLPMDGLGSLVTFQSLTDPILQAGSQVIRSAYDIQKASAISANTPVPSGVLKNNGADLSEGEVQQLLAKWKESRNRGTTAYLTSTLEYQPTAFSPKDMGYKDMLLASATQVARLFNVPAYYLSADETTSMTYSNVQDERKQFVALTLQPWITAIEDRLSMNDITNSQNYVRFEIDDTFLRSDTIERLTALEKMLAMGLISVEEARAMEEMTPESGANNAPNVQ
jgi:HK97 family phage portal protein